jgi:hypothetical protein
LELCYRTELYFPLPKLIRALSLKQQNRAPSRLLITHEILNVEGAQPEDPQPFNAYHQVCLLLMKSSLVFTKVDDGVL